jgi:hypothetical protein
MEFLGSANSIWKLACRCAISDGVPRRSLYVALIVGTVLNLINQGDALLGMASINCIRPTLSSMARSSSGTVSSLVSMDYALSWAEP